MSSFINRNIEMGILSYAIVTEDFKCISDLSSEHFGNPTARRVFTLLQDLNANYKPINEHYIKQEASKYEIEEYEMLDVLCEASLMPSKDYKDMLRELSDKRKLSLVLRTGVTALAKQSSLEVAHMVAKACNDVAQNMFNIDDSFDMTPLVDIQEPPVEFVGLSFLPLPRKSAILLAGRGGVGKSGVALQCAIRHIVETGEKVFAWLSEDPLGETKSRAEKICRQLKVDFNDIGTKLIISNRKPFNIALNNNGIIMANPELSRLQNATKEFGMVVLDPLRSFASNFDENSNSDMDNVTKELTNWAKKENKVIIAIHHANKDGDIRGASSIVDASRLAYIVRDIDGDTKSVEINKDNFGVATMLRSKSIKIQSIRG